MGSGEKGDNSYAMCVIIERILMVFLRKVLNTPLTFYSQMIVNDV